jgi:hypothetical protein
MLPADTVFLVRPARFMYNTETALSNPFQKKTERRSEQIIQKAALDEFNAFEETLKQNGIEVLVFDDTPFPIKPDAVFPNNWVSFHENGKALIYPLFATNRRTEKRMEIISAIQNSFFNYEIIDFSYFENENLFLEGTGSLVFDHTAKIIYAALSARTSRKPLLAVSEILGYEAICFTAEDRDHVAIYHTNVMLAIGSRFALICSESITSHAERKQVLQQLSKTGKDVIDFSYSQMESFCCNAIELCNSDGERITVLSKTAFDALTKIQKKRLNKQTRLLPVQIPTIEQTGGGSARCMLAEVFRPLHEQP